MQFPDLGNFPKYDDIWSTPGIKAAIDIGTNTILLLIAEVQQGQVKTLYEEQRLPRLGKDMGKRGFIALDRMEAAILVLHQYRSIIEKYGDIPVIVTATSAVRDASNKMEFLWMVEEATGYRVRLLSGAEEARCAFVGAHSQVSIHGAFSVDIGGGSTELSYMEADNLVGVSFDIGSVRLTEMLRDLSTPSTSMDFVDQGKALIREIFTADSVSGGKVNWSQLLDKPLLGVAGTATTIAALNVNMQGFRPEVLNGALVRKTYVDKLIDLFSKLTPEQILQLNPELLTGREDLILSGCLILSEIMECTETEEFITSTGGIRHGALLTPLYY